MIPVEFDYAKRIRCRRAPCGARRGRRGRQGARRRPEPDPAAAAASGRADARGRRRWRRRDARRTRRRRRDRHRRDDHARRGARRTRWSHEFASLVGRPPRTVADRQVRHRGTFGGSLAHADPAGDLPAVAIASDAVFEIAGLRWAATGRRRRTSSSTTSPPRLGPDDVLVSVRLPKRPGWGTHYEKFNRMAQTWAMVGVAAAVRRENGSIAEAAIGADQHGLDAGPCGRVEAALVGASATDPRSPRRRRTRPRVRARRPTCRPRPTTGGILREC